MSAQSIITKDFCSIKEEALNSTIKNAQNFLLKKHYRLGKGLCEDTQFKDSIIFGISKFNNASLIEYVNERIKNGPEECFEVSLEDNNNH